VQAIIKGIYFSHYEQSGDIFQMSTPYQIVFGDKNVQPDVEDKYRLGSMRQLEHVKQSQWQYEIFMTSMNSKIQASSMVGAVYLIIAIVYYLMVIESLLSIKPLLAEINSFKQDMYQSHKVPSIVTHVDRSYEIFEEL